MNFADARRESEDPSEPGPLAGFPGTCIVHEMDPETLAHQRAKRRMNQHGFYRFSDGIWRNSQGFTSSMYEAYLAEERSKGEGQ